MSESLADIFAGIHAKAFQHTRAWSTQEIADLLETPHVFSVGITGGFALGRVIVDEAELLTIAVDPNFQGQGNGRVLLSGFEDKARERNATSAFLEVAQDNTEALGLYRTSGWCESGRRRNYYARQSGGKVDALLFTKKLTFGEPSEK